MTIENEGTAQPADPAVPGEGNGVSEGGGEEAKANGVQKRIDQLVAEREQMRAQLAEQQKLTQTLMLETMTRQQQQQQRAPEPQLPTMPSVPEGVDPALYNTFVKAAEATAARQMMELERRMAPLVQQTYRSQAQMQIEREAGGNAELAQRAQRRYDAVIAAGYTMSPADAVLYEEGLIAREARSRQTQNRDELGRFNRAAGGGMNGAGGPINQLTPPAEPSVPSFADQSSDDFNATKAAAYWKDRLKGKK